jgi:hypothetical protein
VNHVGVRVESDDDGLVGSEDTVELLVAETVRMVVLGNESEPVCKA